MNDQPSSPSASLIKLSKKANEDLLGDKDWEGKDKSFAQKMVDKAFMLWISSQNYKQNRMQRIELFERLYNNQIPKKERQLFNICVPIFGGFEDALMANLTDPVSLQFEPTNPMQYLVTPQLQAQWESEKDGLQPNQMWDSKARDDWHNAMLSGRGILKIYSENMPEYRSVLEVVNYARFHCQPLGGGNLENHSFCGEEGIYLTRSDIVNNPERFPLVDQEQFKALAVSSDWWQYIEENFGTHFARFRSLGLDVNSNTFSGTETLYCCQFIVEDDKGVRHFVLFDALTRTPLIVEDLKEFTGTYNYPYVSWATHPDADVFWSKGFSDDIFQIAYAISVLTNQELTAREKANFKPRAYDPLMFTDVAKLDAAQYQPDRLVPVDTMGGTRQISEGIYTFDIGELNGTVEVAQWIRGELAADVGVSDLTQGAAPKTKQNASVILAQQQQIAKRIGFRADPCKIAWSQAGQLYTIGLNTFMPPSLPVKVMGESGFMEKQDLKRSEMTKGNFPWGIKVISTSSQQQEAESKKSARIQALGMLKDSPNVSAEWRDEQTLRDIGGYEDDTISVAMDTQSYGSKRMVAHASKAIQSLLKKQVPPIYRAANLAYMQYILDWSADHETEIRKRGLEPYFMKFMATMAPIAHANEQRNAKAVNAGRAAGPASPANQTSDQAKPPKGAPTAKKGQVSGVEQPGGRATAGVGV